MFEILLNTVHLAPSTGWRPKPAIAFNTRPQDTADVAGRWR